MHFIVLPLRNECIIIIIGLQILPVMDFIGHYSIFHKTISFKRFFFQYAVLACLGLYVLVHREQQCECVQDFISIFIPRSVCQKKIFLILLHKNRHQFHVSGQHVQSLNTHLVKRTGCILSAEPPSFSQSKGCCTLLTSCCECVQLFWYDDKISTNVSDFFLSLKCLLH